MMGQAESIKYAETELPSVAQVSIDADICLVLFMICIILVQRIRERMMNAVRSLLLCLLSALVEVHSQTVPYVSFMGTNLTNHSYVDLTLVGDTKDSNGSDSVQCHTDLSTCCRAAAGPDRGDWYFPNGTQLAIPNITFNIFESRQAQRVDLRHRGRSDVTSGIYRCTIETNAVHNDSGRETVYAGLYASGGEEDMKCH